MIVSPCHAFAGAWISAGGERGERRDGGRGEGHDERRCALQVAARDAASRSRNRAPSRRRRARRGASRAAARRRAARRRRSRSPSPTRLEPVDARLAEEREREQRVEDRNGSLDDRREPGVEPRLAPREEPERHRRVHEPDDDEPAASGRAARRASSQRRAGRSAIAASSDAAEPSRREDQGRRRELPVGDLDEHEGRAPDEREQREDDDRPAHLLVERNAAGSCEIPPQSPQGDDHAPTGRDGRVRCKDAGSVDSSAIRATEDAAARRTARPGGPCFVPLGAFLYPGYTESPDGARRPAPPPRPWSHRLGSAANPRAARPRPEPFRARGLLPPLVGALRLQALGPSPEAAPLGGRARARRGRARTRESSTSADGTAVAFKVESHNHPSAVEPFQGAATGIGGILRDIIAMGARPVALLDGLWFGEPDFQFQQAVAGIGHYGNCVRRAERRRPDRLRPGVLRQLPRQRDVRRAARDRAAALGEGERAGARRRPLRRHDRVATASAAPRCSRAPS